ncbi:hypothetical protein H4R21_006666, partial [Coemansia helicoidea]
DQGLSYICKQSAGASSGAAAAAAAGYVLTVFDDVPGDYQYTPFGEPPALARLPAYLQEPISFERSSASMFYWRMCSHLHQLQADSAAAADSPTSQPQPDGGTYTVELLTQKAADLVVREGVGIGQLFRYMNVLPMFALLEAHLSDTDASFSRLYELRSQDVACLISEEFPDGMLDPGFCARPHGGAQATQDITCTERRQ